jgi:hypothetical protein
VSDSTKGLERLAKLPPDRQRVVREVVKKLIRAKLERMKLLRERSTPRRNAAGETLH